MSFISQLITLLMSKKSQKGVIFSVKASYEKYAKTFKTMWLHLYETKHLFVNN